MTHMLNIKSGARPEIYVLNKEYDPLADLVCASERGTAGLSLLWQELERATLVPAPRAPADFVRMGSRVHFTDLSRRGKESVRLVFPSEAVSRTLVSVASSLGAALVGLGAGDEFEWRDSDGELRRIRIDEVEPPPQSKPRRTSLAQLLAEIVTEDDHGYATADSELRRDRP